MNCHRWFCQGLCKDSKTLLWDNKERCEMGVGNKTEEVIWSIEEEVYDRTSLGNTRLGQRNKSRDKYIRLCYRMSVINKMWKWEVETSRLYI